MIHFLHHCLITWWGAGPQWSWLLPPGIVAVGYLVPWAWSHRP